MDSSSGYVSLTSPLKRRRPNDNGPQHHPPTWTTCTVVSNQAACANASSVLLRVQVSEETSKSFTTPGQYCQVFRRGKPIYLAMANAPGTAPFEFLIKKTDQNQHVTSAMEGSTLEISQALGKGFGWNLNEIFGWNNVILVATGTGIAPLNSVVESGCLLSWRNGGEGHRKLWLYFGNRTWEDTPFLDLVDAWHQKCGVRVVPVLSDPVPAHDDGEVCPRYRWGHVQTALLQDGCSSFIFHGNTTTGVCTKAAGALICGHPHMMVAVRNLLENAGVQVCTNY